MLSTYDLKSFSSRLKDIRLSCGYSQENVTNATGLSAESLRKLEKGLVIPRYDTIEILSMFYKVDLQSILNNYKSSASLIKFYDKIDYYLTRSEFSSLLKTIDEFQEFSSSADHNLISENELIQLELFFEGLKVSCSDNHSKEVQKQAIEIYIKALQACNQFYDFERWDTYKYNYLELRILFAIGSLYGFLRECELSNKILFFIYNSFDMSIYSKHNDKLLASKVIAAISYNYHRIDRPDLALEYAEKGIKFCDDFQILANYELFLIRKGAAIFYLGLEGYDEYFDQAITLLKIQRNFEYADFCQKTIDRLYKKAKV